MITAVRLLLSETFIFGTALQIYATSLSEANRVLLSLAANRVLRFKAQEL